MKKLNNVLAIIFLIGFAGTASAASLSWTSTQAGSTVTDASGNELSVQFGFEHNQGAFSHSYSYSTDQPNMQTTAFYIELLNEFISLTSITLDGGALTFDAANQRWTGNGTLGQASHTLQISGNVLRSGQQYQVFVQSAIPVPAAVWLFGSALVGLFGVIRRQL